MLKVEAVTYKAKKKNIVKDITFTVRPGEVVTILGANGAGKSTLMRMLSGESMPDNGDITLYGKKISAYATADLACIRATLSQQNIVNVDFLCEEIVMMGRYPHQHKKTTNRDAAIVTEVMDICGVAHLAERSFLSLSGGEQQRVQLARILAQVWDSPDSLILLDEPVAGLDMLYQQQTMAIAKALTRKGYMVVAILHDINLAAQYADRMLLMKNGRRWCDGTPSEVLTPLNIYTVFSVDAEVVINPRTLNPYVIFDDIKMNAADFNGSLPDKIIPQQAIVRTLKVAE